MGEGPKLRPQPSPIVTGGGRGRLRSAARRAAPWIPLILLVSVCLLVAAAVSSCGTEPPDWQTSAPRAQIPDIRVLLTGGAIDAATVQAEGGGAFKLDGRAVIASRGPISPVRIRRSGKTWSLNNLSAEGDLLVLQTPADGRFLLNGAVYRGTLQLHPAGTDRFLAVNHLDIESYLAGVLAKELYLFWSPETYRAQAIAARTFAMYHKTTFGARHSYDLGDDQASQVYGGFAAETPKAWKAVRQTHGKVLAYGQKGKERIFLAQYSACNGGVVNGAYVIRDAAKIPPLMGGQVDEDGKRCRHYRWGPVRITKADLHKALKASAYSSADDLGDVKEIKVAAETPYGRMHWLDVLDSQGNRVRLRAEDLRLVLLRWGPSAGRRLYSMNCGIRDLGDSFEFHNGRGFGHGVGLSQWGTEDKARRGQTAEQILQFYYPGAAVIRAY